MKVFRATNDICFKLVFHNNRDTTSVARSKAILIDFINTIMRRIGKDEVIDIQYDQNEQLASVDVKTVIPNLVCTSRNGTFLVQLQLGHHQGFLQRIQMHGAHLLYDQVLKGQAYDKPKPVTVIAICDFHAVKDPTPISVHRMVDIETKKSDINLNLLEIVLIQLPNFNNSNIAELKDDELWIYYFQRNSSSDLTEEDLRIIQIKNPMVMAALELLDQSQWTEEDLKAYIAFEHVLNELNEKHLCIEKAKKNGKEILEVVRNMLSLEK